MASDEVPGVQHAERDDWRQLVEFLSNPASYLEHSQRVECIETHISLVFLTERHAYKLKKRVAFDFLDFRMAAARHAACEAEVRLNQRLAPDVYLGVEGLSRNGAGNYHWAGPRNAACEWVVKMRRLPEERRLDRILSAGTLRDDEFERLASLLVRFYQQLPPLSVRADDYLAQLWHHVEGNEFELAATQSPLAQDVVHRVHDAQRRLLRLGADHWRSRVCDGRIVEGHGDLRPEHVYLLHPPVVIDAIEFNAEFRSLDVLDELSFLAIECEMLGAGVWGRRLIDRYCRAMHDVPAPGVLEFYRSYRAAVRAKVALLRSRQLAGDQRRCAIDLARRYLAVAQQSLGDMARPWLVVVRGLSGTGKSQLAEQIADRLCAEHRQTDVLRQTMSSRSPAEVNSEPAEYGEGKYAPAQRQQVYDELLRRAEQGLRAGHSQVLDGTFLAAAARMRTARLAEQLGARWLEVTCRCPREVARTRVLQRSQRPTDASEMRADWLDMQARDEEACEPTWATLIVDTTPPAEEVAEGVLRNLTARVGLGAAGPPQTPCEKNPELDELAPSELRRKSGN